MVGRIALLALAAVAFSGCRSEPFGCESNEQCQVDTAAGVCEANGYCSFSDPECESGRRYSNLAGGGLAGLCVNTPAETTGPGSSSGPGTTTVNPMTGLTTELTTMGSSSETSTTVDGTSTSGAASTGTGTTGDPGSSGTGGPDIDDGLVVYVSFDDAPTDDGSYVAEPGHLVALCDSVGSGCPAVVPGMVGSAGQFDGVDDVVRVDDDARLRFQESMSMCLWTRRTGPFAGEYAFLAGKAFGNDSANSYEFYLANPDEETLTHDVIFSTDSSPASGWQSAGLTNDWTHLCGIWDGELWRLYVNGIESGSEPLASAPSYDALPFQIGADTESGSLTHFFPGEIDEVRLYERALSGSEVMTLASEG